MKTTRIEVNSSMINSIGYTTRGKLIVEFVGNRTYEYTKVPMSLILQMLASDSIGKFFNMRVKGNFKYTEVR